MVSLESIVYDDQTFAMVFRNQQLSQGVHFLTPSELSLQIGMLVHPAGKQVKPHVHQKQEKLVHSTYEVLFIIEGRIEVEFFSLDGTLKGVRELAAGDAIILMNGGHGLKVLDSCRILEVKQGPYYGVEAEKLFIEPHAQ